MLNLLAAEKIKLLRSKKLWIVLSILFLLPILQVVNISSVCIMEMSLSK